MIWARSVLFFALLVLNTVAYATPFVVIGWVIPYAWLCGLAGSWARTSLWLLRVICGLGYRIQGLQNIPQGGAIIMAKHQSAWETIALRGILPPLQTWILKRELTLIPMFGWALLVAQPIAIDRKAGRQSVRKILTQGAQSLKRGRYVIIFPEGTRVAPGCRKKYGIGGGLLAAETGYPVVPIAHNAGVFWGRRDLRKYPGTIQVVVGPAIDTEGLSAAEITRRTESWIEGTLGELPTTPEVSALQAPAKPSSD